MSFSIESLGIDQLSVRERLDLIEQIWDSLPEKISPEEIASWHFAELAKRRTAAEGSPNESEPWREALARIEEKA